MKKHMKKLLFVMVLMLTIVTFATIVNAAPVKNRSSWANESIAVANKGGLLSTKYYLGDFTALTTRGEVAELLTNAYNSLKGTTYYPSSPSPFSDTSSIAVRTVYELGIMSGKGDGKFGYYDNITREEMAKVLLTFRSVATGKKLGLPQQPYSNFKDFWTVSTWAKPYVAQANVDWLISGYPDGTFRPKDNVSREMAIVLITRCAKFPNNQVPVITSLSWEGKVSSSQDIPVRVSGNGIFELYVASVDNLKYPHCIGSAWCGDTLYISKGMLDSNSLYYVFVKCNGVFSDPVKIYTDSYNVFLKGEEYHSALDGRYEIAWERVPGATEYIITITEQRNSRHEGDIPPNTPVSHKVQWESSYKINVNPNRTYKIEIKAGNYYDTQNVYIYSNPAKDWSEIYESYPTTKEQADALQVSVTVPVWKINSRGQKYSSTATFKVHRKIADKVKLVFQEIYNGPEKFPIKDIGGYSWRGGTTEHNGGTAIDINSNENYCIYNNGTKIGSHWKPYVDKYSITPYGDVVKAFEKYGFTWGGDAWSNPRDYMHFSYLGT